MSKKHTLLTTRDYYKPFQYGWCFEAYRKMRDMDWRIDEVPLHDDIVDWNSKLKPHELNLLTQLFRFFTTQDVMVADGYRSRYMPAFGGHPEVSMMLWVFGASEANHVEAYAGLLDTIGMPEVEYMAFKDYAAMRDKHDYIYAERSSSLNKKEKLALDLAIFSAFAEGCQLFSSFAMLLSFRQRGLMKGMGTIVEYSIRDEAWHVENMTRLFRTFIEENPKIWTDEFKSHIYQACRDMVDLEDKFIDLALEQGAIEGMTPESVKEYVRYIADRRLNQLGLKSNYGIDKNPFPWLDDMLALPVHTNFFEGRATEYSKQGLEGWNEVWNDKET